MALPQQLYAISLCIVYMLVGPSLILLNKFILSKMDFPFPMFLSGLGVLVSGVVAQLLVRSGVVVLQRKEQVEGMLWYRRVLPVGMAHAGTLAFGNIVYLYLGVGFIQMLKSFTPVIILMAGIVARIETPNQTTILSVLVISLGTAATCSFTAELNFMGLLVMLLAEVTEAGRLLMTQFLLQNLKFGVVEGQYVIAPASAFWLFLASAVFELQEMRERGAFGIMLRNPLPFALASCLGLAINFLSYLVIQVTSSLTMKVLGTARNVFTILLGIVCYGEAVPGLQESLGYSVALAGFACFNMAKAGSWNRVQCCGVYLDTLSVFGGHDRDGEMGLGTRSDEADAEQGVALIGAGAEAGERVDRVGQPAPGISPVRTPKKRQNSVDVR